MHKKAVVQQMMFPPGRRVLAVSDIHGNLPFLKGLLAEARVTREDILVLVGDLIEKGPDSLATLHFIMDLARTHKICALSGNCDQLVADFALEPALIPAFYHRYLKVWGERSVLLQMARAADYQGQAPHDLSALQEIVRAHFPEELAWLRALPTVLETPDYLFVHGGVPREDRLEALDAWACMKNDDFRSQGHAFRRWCVVGHWPVTLYRPSIPSDAPLLDREAHIASIDGGCVLKLGGQLNALVLPERPGEDFSWIAYDGLPQVAALDGQTSSKNPVNIRWGRNTVELLERGEELSRCRHLDSGRELELPTCFLYEEDGTLKSRAATDYRLPVEPGDRLHIVHRVRGGCLAKKDGITGWYFGRLDEEPSI